MTGALLVAGTCSDAGKSVVVAGICRWLRRQGVRVAPFKAQNMALNSVVTPGGAEIGRAQAVQAAAAGIEPEAVMNPVLLKPTGERHSQVVVLGRPHAEVDAVSYQQLRPELMPLVLDALEGLRRRFDVVVCEGAGSPAEVNLRDGDLVNMGLARAAGMPVIVVGDIDRGGVLAALFGSLALLDRGDQALVAGFLINKFRGDASILAPGLDRIRALTGRPVLGVLPWVRGLWLDVEDSLTLEAPRDGATPPIGRDGIAVAVVRLPRMSNFTDLDALAAEPGVAVRFTESAAEVASANLVVVPGSKATVDDLAWVRGRGLERALIERARRGRPILGICGGYQMLGARIVDEVESRAGDVSGLGLLPVVTDFHSEKVLANRSGSAPGFGGLPVCGYEIHHGQVRRTGGEPLFVCAAGEEGCRSRALLGTSWHGALEADEFRRGFLQWVAVLGGLDWTPGATPFSQIRERRLDLVGDLIEAHVETQSLMRLIEDGPLGSLPFVSSGLAGGVA